MKLFDLKKNTLLKKVFCIFLSVLMMIPICGVASVVGSCNNANLSAEREVRAGYSYLVRLVLDSPATGYEGYFAYDASVLSLTRIVPVNSDLYVDFQVTTETGYVRVTHSTAVRQMLLLTFFVNENAKAGTEAMVRFYSGTVINGEQTEKVADSSFRFVVVDRKSSDATLKELNVSVYESREERDQDKNGFIGSLAPEFSSTQSVYSLTVAHDYSHFRVTATPNDPSATVTSVSDGELSAGAVNKVNVVVRAEDGAQQTYVIQIFRELDPDTSLDISYPEINSSDEESFEDSSEESEESGISDEVSEEDSSDDASKESEFSSVESSQIDESVGSEADPSGSESVFESSGSISITTFSEGSNDRTSNTDQWTRILVAIAAFGALAIAVLVIRIMLLIHKKRK